MALFENYVYLYWDNFLEDDEDSFNEDDIMYQLRSMVTSKQGKAEALQLQNLLNGISKPYTASTKGEQEMYQQIQNNFSKYIKNLLPQLEVDLSNLSIINNEMSGFNYDSLKKFSKPKEGQKASQVQTINKVLQNFEMINNFINSNGSQGSVKNLLNNLIQSYNALKVAVENEKSHKQIFYDTNIQLDGNMINIGQALGDLVNFLDKIKFMPDHNYISMITEHFVAYGKVSATGLVQEKIDKIMKDFVTGGKTESVMGSFKANSLNLDIFLKRASDTSKSTGRIRQAFIPYTYENEKYLYNISKSQQTADVDTTTLKGHIKNNCLPDKPGSI